MPEQIKKHQRWLDLIAHLVGRHYPVAVDELMERIPAYARKWTDGSDTDRDSVRRMFERDKAELKALGFPLEPVSYRINYGEPVEGYHLTRRDVYLPYLKLVREAAEPEDAAPAASRDTLEVAPEDAGVALDALREASDRTSFPLADEASSAFRKLAFDLDPERLLDEPSVLYVDRPGAEALEGTVRVLSDALLARKRVRFRYHGIYRGESTSRDVAPYGLLFHGGHWYLVGPDAARDDAMRVFRVGRMEAVEPNGRRPKTPDYEIPDDFRMDEYRDREAWELGGEDEPPVRARVRFRFPMSLWAERNGHGELLEEDAADGAAVRAFTVHQVNPFLRWLLSLEGEAEVLGPPELEEEMRAMARAVAAVYGAEGSDG